MIHISAKKLRKANACQDQVRLFLKTFGDGKVVVTRNSCAKALAVGLDVNWAARQFLDGRAFFYFNERKELAFREHLKRKQDIENKQSQSLREIREFRINKPAEYACNYSMISAHYKEARIASLARFKLEAAMIFAKASSK